MHVNYKISRVHLTSRVRQLLIAVLSVTFGISMYIFMNSFMSGVNDAQSEITFTSMAHIRIYNDDAAKSPVILTEPSDSNTITMISNNRSINYTEGMKNVPPIIEALLNVEEVTSVTSQLNQNVFIRNGVSKLNANLSGVDVPNENEVFKTSGYLVEGDFFDLEKRSDGMILGVKLAENLGVSLGSNVKIITSDGVSKVFKIIGLIETGSSGTDRTRALISIQNARQSALQK